MVPTHNFTLVVIFADFIAGKLKVRIIGKGMSQTPPQSGWLDELGRLKGGGL
jgi:hypothetical protein